MEYFFTTYLTHISSILSYHLLVQGFSQEYQLIVFHWSLSDSKSPQVSRTLLSILANLRNAVVWMVFTRLLIFKSSCPFNNTLVTVPKELITIAIIITFMFHSFFNSLTRFWYLSFFFFFYFLSILFCCQPGQQSLQFFKCSFLLSVIRSSRLAEIRWSVSMSKPKKRICESFSKTGDGLCIYHLFAWSNFSFLHNSQWITLPTQLCLILYSFCANFQHSLECDWSFRLQHHITYISYFVTSYLFFIW